MRLLRLRGCSIDDRFPGSVLHFSFGLQRILPVKIPFSSAFTRLAIWSGGRYFRKLQPSRLHPPVPAWKGCVPLETASCDQCTIRGWWQPKSTKSGTVIFIHGITIHSFYYLEQAQYVSRETGLSVAACDLRSHGISDDAPLAFGAAEAWDVRAFLTALETAGASRPFIVIGDSLGGLATQRAVAEDDRIDGAVLMQTPGWPWNAIKRTAKRLSSLARFLNSHYGYNILDDGDPRSVPRKSHYPPLLYLVGDRDFYDSNATRSIFDWWELPNPGESNETPITSPDRSGWYILVEGAEHDTGLPDSYNVWRWPEVWPNILRFIEIVHERSA